MRYETHTIRAYAKSKGIKLIEAFFEAYKGFNELQELTDAHQLAIANDMMEYNKSYKCPPYVTGFLDHERLRQLSLTPRYGPKQPVWFGN